MFKRGGKQMSRRGESVLPRCTGGSDRGREDRLWHVPAAFNASWQWNKGRQRGAELPHIKKEKATGKDDPRLTHTHTHTHTHRRESSCQKDTETKCSEVFTAQCPTCSLRANFYTLSNGSWWSSMQDYNHYGLLFDYLKGQHVDQDYYQCQKGQCGI